MIDSGRKDRHLWKLKLGYLLLGKLDYFYSSDFENTILGILDVHGTAWHVMAALRIGAKNFKRKIIFIKFIPILSNGHVVK